MGLASAVVWDFLVVVLAMCENFERHRQVQSSDDCFSVREVNVVNYLVIAVDFFLFLKKFMLCCHQREMFLFAV